MVSEKVYFFDACAAIAFLNREPGSEVLAEILAEGHRCLIHAIQACEVYYDCIRGADDVRARSLLEQLCAAGLEIDPDLHSDVWMEAGRLKVRYGRFSLADAFALAFTKRTGAILLTSDHKELERLVPMNICTIQFFR